MTAEQKVELQIYYGMAGKEEITHLPCSILPEKTFNSRGGEAEITTHVIVESVSKHEAIVKVPFDQRGAFTVSVTHGSAVKTSAEKDGAQVQLYPSDEFCYLSYGFKKRDGETEFRSFWLRLCQEKERQPEEKNTRNSIIKNNPNKGY